MSPHRRAVVVACALNLTAGLAGCHDRSEAPAPAVVVEARSLSSAVRDNALTRARVWSTPAVPTEQADFTINTPGAGALSTAADVDCAFSVEPVGGETPKSACSVGTAG